MMTQLSKIILVFKTNLESDERLEIIKPLLDKHPAILKWNVDRHDVDKVLRVESENIAPGDIITLIQKAGFLCEELCD